MPFFRLGNTAWEFFHRLNRKGAGTTFRKEAASVKLLDPIMGIVKSKGTMTESQSHTFNLARLPV